MIESNSPSDSDTLHPQPTALPKPRSEPRWRHLVGFVALVAIALLAWQLMDTRSEMHRMRDEFTRKINDSDTASKEARVLAQQSDEAWQAIQAKVGALESRVAESQNQQATLESLYQEFTRQRDERVLADVDQAVSIADQQLQLASNVPAALVALQEADSRLAQLDRPKLLPLRKQITRDIERLRALPLADVTSMNVQLDGMLGQIDGLPMGFEHLPAKPVVASVAGSAKSQRKAGRSSQRNESASLPVAASAPQENDDTGFGSGVLTLMNDLWSDFSQLIRIERLDRPDPALLSPQSAAYLRENLRLRLLSARLALLQRDGKVLNEDVSQARIWLERYFDVTAPAVASMLTDLKQIEGAKLNVELPSLNETEAVLRNLRLDAR